MAYLNGKFVWFEHASGDIAKANKFYGELFGWKGAPFDMGGHSYHMLMNGEAGVGGMVPTAKGAPARWMGYMSVTDVDASTMAAEKAGAKVVMPPTDFPGAGRAATLTDPTGATFSLWKGNQDDPPDENPVPPGKWCWNELSTSNAKAALAFYETAFGYTHDEMDMGSQGTYYLLKQGDVMRAGLMQSPAPNMPSAWTPYVEVKNCDETFARAKQMGATECVPPTDIPEVGRMAMIIDPQGAMIAFMQTFPMQ